MSAMRDRPARPAAALLAAPAPGGVVGLVGARRLAAARRHGHRAPRHQPAVAGRALAPRSGDAGGAGGARRARRAECGRSRGRRAAGAGGWLRRVRAHDRNRRRGHRASRTDRLAVDRGAALDARERPGTVRRHVARRAERQSHGAARRRPSRRRARRARPDCLRRPAPRCHVTGSDAGRPHARRTGGRHRRAAGGLGMAPPRPGFVGHRAARVCLRRDAAGWRRRRLLVALGALERADGGSILAARGRAGGSVPASRRTLCSALVARPGAGGGRRAHRFLADRCRGRGRCMSFCERRASCLADGPRRPWPGRPAIEGSGRISCRRASSVSRSP